MKNRLFVLLIGFLFIGQVSAELGGVCEGNVLFWYDYKGNNRNRDCAVLHGGSNKVFRGECREYAGGAACYATNGTVSHEYIIETRKNASNIINPPTTTTTLPGQPDIIVNVPDCPKCVYTDCTEVTIERNALNRSLNTCRDNKDFFESEYRSRVDKSTYSDMVSKKDTEIKGAKDLLATCEKEKSYIEEWMYYYQLIAIFSAAILVFVIYVWVKKPGIEDREADLGKIEKRE